MTKKKSVPAKQKKSQTDPDPAPENEETDSSEPEEEDQDEKDPLDVLIEQLNQKDEELAEQKNAFMLLQAETDNFKKRMRREKEDFAQFANEKLLKELLSIYDNLTRALTSPNPSVENLMEGVKMILNEFDSFLKREKVEPIPALGETFDPSVHEVLSQIESTEHEENTIIEEYTKGYSLNGRILKSAQVVIAKSPKEDPSPASTEVASKEDNEEEENPSPAK